VVRREIERIAFAGDWHMNWRWARRAVRYAADQGAQHIVHTGDFGYTFQQQFLDEVTSVLDATGIDLWFVDGNYESFPWLNRVAVDLVTGRRPLSRRIEHLPRGYRWEWGAVHFLAMGGAHSVDRMARIPGREWWPEETITPRQVHQAGAQGSTDVLVSHDAPAGCVIPGIDDVDAPSWIPAPELKLSFDHRLRFQTLCSATRPSAIWHGHYHTRHRTIADLGYGPVVVNGLDCDESSLDDNIVVVDVADLLVRDVPLVEGVEA
jgi:predicted phosphodiesterase